MSQRLRVFAVLAEGLTLAPITHVRWTHNHLQLQLQRDVTPLGSMVTCTQVHTLTHRQIPASII